jgi:L-serine dehydratase
MISVFDLFKIGIGPSSSHTVGPMVAAHRFVALLNETVGLGRVGRIKTELFGSLAWTAKGHGTETAILLGLSGFLPAEVDPDLVEDMIASITRNGSLELGGVRAMPFTLDEDLVPNKKELMKRHSNAMKFQAFSAEGGLITEKAYYSIGGGFVVTDEEEASGGAGGPDLPYKFTNAVELLALSNSKGKSFAALQRDNERVTKTDAEIDASLDKIREVMFACIDRGCRQEGILPGGLKVKRRAKSIHQQLEAGKSANRRPAHEIMDWVSLYAIAVNEENAAGGRVVTAPTNGAAGIIPAVLRYAKEFCPEYSIEASRDYMLTAAAVGSLIKQNASISGAEVGCQGEVGSASAMAAGGLCALLGGTPEQIENAAEIALEHHLGMTCDPIGGLVQIPCIERNAFGANKAIVAASLSLRGDGTHRVSLDEVIETMRQTGIDMLVKYKETAQGGLAVNVADC